MQPKKFRILSAITAGSPALAVAATRRKVSDMNIKNKLGRISFGSLRRPKAALLALALVLGLAPAALILAPEAQAAANPPGCATVDTYRTYGWGSIRGARVHLVAKWCWDDRTVTATFAPYDYFTATNVGSFYMSWKKTSITETWQDPQFGGNWTRDILLQGNIDVSVFKYGHIKTIPVNIDLKLFGDGVYYATGF